MPFPLLILPLAALEGVRGLVLPQPEATLLGDHVANLIDGWSPKPTERPLPRWLGAIEEKHLFPRQSGSYTPDTCGWTSANPDYPATCGDGSGCAYYTGVEPQNFGCCPMTNGAIDFDNCPYYSTCIDNGQSSNAYSGSVVIIADPTVYW